MTRILAVTTLAAGIAVASAQNLSQQCQNSLTTVATNQDASTCLAPGPLLGIATANSSTSLVDPINNWLGSLCAAAPCSNSTLDFIVNTVTEGCAAELTLLGYSSNQRDVVSAAVKQYYPTVRQVLCLKQGNDICIIQQLKAVEGTVGPLSIDNIVNLALGGGFNSTSSIPKNVTCSDCSKAQYNLINKAIPGTFDDSKSDIQNECGASFVDGQNPSGISQSAAATGTNGNNGASMLSAFPDTLSTYALLAVGGLFAMAA